jgi:hypothetical protein
MGMIKQFVSGAAIGAGTAYLYDSGCGPDRRARLQEKTAELGSRAQRAVGRASEEASNRVRQWADTARTKAQQSAFAQDEWSPSGRYAAGLLGALLVLTGRRRGGLMGIIRSIAGGALLIRAIRNRPYTGGEIETSENTQELDQASEAANRSESLNPSMSTAGESGLKTGRRQK